MYTLDIDIFKKTSKKYLLFSIFCLVFSLIYESFSHNVYSNYMIFSFLIPLIMGTLIFYILYKFKLNYYINNFSYITYNMSIATFTIGSIIMGFLEIYGTTNSLTKIYAIVGIVTLIISIISVVLKKLFKFI